MDLLIEIMTTITALFGIHYVIHYVAPKKRKMRKIPGPTSYPFIGNILLLDPKQPHETFRIWAKQHGNVMKVNLFGEDIVIANSFESINEVVMNNDIADRPNNYRFRALVDNNDDIGLSNITPKWSFLKKTTISGLKQVSTIYYPITR